MHLTDVIKDTGLSVATDPDITGIALDSRAVKPGFLFAALPGAKLDGAAFIPDAVKAGAVTVLVQTGTDVSSIPDHVVVLEVPNARLTLAFMLKRFYRDQPDMIAAITGTSGKTSIVNFTRQIWTALDLKAASMGTLGIIGPDFYSKGELTTPDAVSVYEGVADIAHRGITHLAMEASSHGLDQYRLHGLKIDIAGFSNLSQDHLDYHTDMEDYFQAKVKLFTEVMSKDGTAVINTDDPYGARLHDICVDAGMKTITYGKYDADIELVSRLLDPKGQTIEFSIFGRIHTVFLPLVGSFQAYNVLCAMAMVLAQYPEREQEVVAFLPTIQSIPGRMETIEGHPRGAGVYVDYSHKPDPLEQVLKALRPHTHGRLVVVFGCGGDRDRTKRPIMGKIAQDFSDLAIVTDDNPRSETPSQIRADIMVACPDAMEIGDRREAIRYAIQNLDSDDVLVIAGKGHEAGQIVGSTILPFDDRTVAREEIQNLKNQLSNSDLSETTKHIKME